jgi:hypothetical protein
LLLVVVVADIIKVAEVAEVVYYKDMLVLH